MSAVYLPAGGFNFFYIIKRLGVALLNNFGDITDLITLDYDIDNPDRALGALGLDCGYAVTG